VVLVPTEAVARQFDIDADAPAVRRPATLQEARALAHPLRIRILRLCLDHACTNAELAAALGQQPATVLYHVRTLLATGFLAEEPTRPGPRGTVEKPYRATGKSWRLDHTMTSEDGSMLRAVFEAVAAEVEEAGPDPVLEGARMALRLRPDQLTDLLGQIRTLISQYPAGADYLADDPPGTDPYALLLVLHRRNQPDAGAAGTEAPEPGPARRKPAKPRRGVR
jgi:DNA-binding transcriptional ArsR family regulator